MKKFIFSLDAVYELKKTLKDKLQAEYAAAEAVLKSAIQKKNDLDRILSQKSEEYELKLKKGMAVGNIKEYILFFEELQDLIKASIMDIENAQKAVDLKQAELIDIFKEIEILKKLRQKQNREYLMEEDKKEIRMLEDILSFEFAEFGTNNGG
jgi:flagellar protein FliJ